MCIKLVSSLTVLALVGIGVAQPARLAWSRNSASPGVTMDTARDGLVSQSGHFIVVGARKPAGVPPLGIIAKIDRRTATGNFANLAPVGGGPLEFFKVLEDEGNFYAFGTTRPVGSNSDRIFVAKFDSTLTLLASNSFEANTYIGREKPTDVGIDANNNIYITGVAQKNNIWQMFVARTGPALAGFALNYAKLDFTDYNEPSLSVNGIIAVLIGLRANNGPVVRSYQPGGLLNYHWTVNLPGSNHRAVFSDLSNAPAAEVVAASWTEQVSPGVFESHGSVFQINPLTGVQQARFDLLPEVGNGTLNALDVAPSLWAPRSVNTLFHRSNQAFLQSFTGGLLSTSVWGDPLVVSSGASFVAALDWGDVIMAIGRGAVGQNLVGLASNNVTRFSINTPAYNLLLPFIEQDNLLHLASGDVLAIRTDNDRMQLNYLQQAPVAITNSYSPKSGLLFRPTYPVTFNDRFAEGSAITIVQQPMHGLVTIGANGYFNYRSNAGYVGADSFRYQLAKPGLTPSSATVNLTVTP